MEEYTAFDPERFVTAQLRDFETALSEIRSGRKQSHWMWYIFPQLAGLGTSYYARYFAIADLDAARSYLCHPYLRGNLVAICGALLALEETNPGKIMDFPDDRKLHSSMTLFSLAAPEIPEFSAVLNRFFGGSPDPLTLELLHRQSTKSGKENDYVL